MKLLTIMLLGICLKANAMNILLSYFDPFGGKPANNSATVAKITAKNLELQGHKVFLCELRTVYDLAHEELMDCLHSQSEKVDMVVSLGEAGCKKIKIETRGKNFDKSGTADNDGVMRSGTPILNGGEDALGVTLPMDEAYCSLSNTEKRNVLISNDAGSFVCNNTLYHGLNKFDLPYTFIHVPTAKCASEKSNQTHSEVIAKMLHNTENFLLNKPMPANLDEVKDLLDTDLNRCYKSFYKVLKRKY